MHSFSLMVLREEFRRTGEARGNTFAKYIKRKPDRKMSIIDRCKHEAL